MRRVVITGCGIICSGGLGKEEFWKNSLSGKSFITSYNSYPNQELLSRVKGSVDKFSYRDFNISDEDAKRTGRHTQFAIACTEEAIMDAGLRLAEINKERIGVCIGNAIADTPCSELEYLKIKENLHTNTSIDDLLDPHLYSKAMFNCLSTEISSRYGCMGDTFTMTTGCTSGIDAVGYAYEVIKEGKADIFICGASEAPIACITFASFDKIGATSRKNDIPEKASSPFDSTRDGFVIAEGCGIVIIEELEHAIKRKAKIYAEILSFTTKNNAIHMTDLPSDGMPLEMVINMAIEQANIDKTDIDYINAHGSSTPQNDICESQAYKAVLGDHAYKIPITSTKSIVGHPLGAASAVEIIHCCLIMQHNVVSPTVNIEHPDPLCDLNYVAGKPQKHNVNVCLTNASGFSGIHSVMILKKI